ncbi:sigma 54-interacting transcriptional regulator [Sorangium sp. So ce134]
MTSERKPALERSTLTGGSLSTEVAGPAARLALTILHHPHMERVGDRALLPELAAGALATVSRAEPTFAPPGQAQGAPLGDPHLSRKPIRLLSIRDGGVQLDPGESSTAVVVRGKRLLGAACFSAAQIRRGVIVELGHRILLLLHTVNALQGTLGVPDEPREIAGESDGIRQVLWEIRSVADLALPVLIRGETGSGKELVARALHQASPRRDHPFVAVNLGAIAPSLAISELFGAERGAHSAATRRQPGYVEQARGGTLFLDEIGEAPVELQVALLRFIETGEVQTLGAQVRKVDVRILAATDADLEAKVAAGTFRAPLLNRLSACEISIPPLRARRDDIGRLFARFLREELERVGEPHRMRAPAPEDEPWLPAPLIARLAEHDWPGNIRQLRNVVRQLVVGSRGRSRLELTPAVERLLAEPAPSEGPTLRSDDELSLEPQEATDPPPASAPAAPLPSKPAASSERAAEPRAPRRAPAEVSEDELTAALRANRWNVSAAAKHLGIPRPSIYMLMKRYESSRGAVATAPEEILRCYRECGGDLGRMADRLGIAEWSLAQRVRKLGLE